MSKITFEGTLNDLFQLIDLHNGEGYQICFRDDTNAFKTLKIDGKPVHGFSHSDYDNETCWYTLDDEEAENDKTLLEIGKDVPQEIFDKIEEEHKKRSS